MVPWQVSTLKKLNSLLVKPQELRTDHLYLHEHHNNQLSKEGMHTIEKKRMRKSTRSIKVGKTKGGKGGNGGKRKKEQKNKR